jgi:DNA-directed RNA polymerase-3 subunit RPC5
MPPQIRQPVITGDQKEAKRNTGSISAMAGDKQKAKSHERQATKDKVKVEIVSGGQTINQIPPLEKKKTRAQKAKTEKNRVVKDKRNQKDPVVASYDVFLKSRLKDGKKLYVFQFPNRDAGHPYSAACNNMPLEIRIKKISGLVEVDVPINTSRDYDREKGAKWGDAIQKSNPGKGSGGLGVGLAAGFGVGASQPARPRGLRRDQGQEEITQEDLMRDWAASVAQEKVLTKQTLGGQILPKDPTKPRYFVGAFRGGKCFHGEA